MKVSFLMLNSFVLNWTSVVFKCGKSVLVDVSRTCYTSTPISSYNEPVETVTKYPVVAKHLALKLSILTGFPLRLADKRPFAGEWPLGSDIAPAVIDQL